MEAGNAIARVATPIGLIEVRANAQWLTRVRIFASATNLPDTPAPPTALLAEALAQITAWFDGALTQFDLPLAPPASADAHASRGAIAAIPYGETRTYGALATATGSIARAVGQACKTNPFPLIIPCHRVTSASGPEYYSAGAGPRTKSWLIDFEYSHLPPEQRTRLI